MTMIAPPAPGHRASRRAFLQHLDAGEPPCAACAAANALYAVAFSVELGPVQAAPDAPPPAAVAVTETPSPTGRGQGAACEPFARRQDRAHGYLPGVPLPKKRRLIRHIAGDIAPTAADAELLFDALGLDPRDGKIEC